MTGAIFECDRCIGGTTGIETRADCGGECKNQNEIIIVGGKEYYQSKKDKFCDASLGNYINM